MKKILLIIILFFICIINVSASTEKFEAGDWISNIYINKEKDGVIHYKQARFITRKSNGGIAYCIEPFKTLKENENYNGYTNDYAKRLGISDAVWKKISLIAYYGYGYEKHTADKWFAITQVMIWREVDKKASFYFTDSLNGKKINSYDDEIKEINQLIINHNKLPSFANKKLEYSINSENIINDTNNVLKYYNMTVSDNNTKIEKSDNELKIKTSTSSTIIKFERKFTNYKSSNIVFVDSNYQNLMTPGNVESIKFDLEIITKSGKLKIIKIDEDNQTTQPSGEGILIGTEYTLYDKNNNIIKEIVIGENNEGYVDELPYGKYVLKETKSMKGYILDNNTYNIEINSENENIEMKLSNKIIKSKIKIYKYCEDKLEENINFEIYNNKNELVNAIVTNNEGYAEIELPYGNYRFHQLNSTKNYLPVDDFIVSIDENSEKEIRYDLVDKLYSIELRITKKDKETGKIISQEAIFKIRNTETGEYVKKNDSNLLKTTNGKLKIEKLNAGSYELEEFKAPNGYKKLNQKILFDIDEDNNYDLNSNNYPVYEIIVENEKEYINIEVPNTNQDYKNKEVYIINRKKHLYFLKLDKNKK